LSLSKMETYLTCGVGKIPCQSYAWRHAFCCLPARFGVHVRKIGKLSRASTLRDRTLNQGGAR